MKIIEVITFMLLLIFLEIFRKFLKISGKFTTPFVFTDQMSLLTLNNILKSSKAIHRQH